MTKEDLQKYIKEKMPSSTSVPDILRTYSSLIHKRIKVFRNDGTVADDIGPEYDVTGTINIYVNQGLNFYLLRFKKLLEKASADDEDW